MPVFALVVLVSGFGTILSFSWILLVLEFGFWNSQSVVDTLVFVVLTTTQWRSLFIFTGMITNVVFIYRTLRVLIFHFQWRCSWFRGSSAPRVAGTRTRWFCWFNIKQKLSSSGAKFKSLRLIYKFLIVDSLKCVKHTCLTLAIISAVWQHITWFVFNLEYDISNDFNPEVFELAHWYSLKSINVHSNLSVIKWMYTNFILPYWCYQLRCFYQSMTPFPRSSVFCYAFSNLRFNCGLGTEGQYFS